MRPLLLGILVLLPIALPGELSAQQTHQTQSLTIFAAASLTDAFKSLRYHFSTSHQNVKIDFNFGGSQQLAYQIDQGAPADLFASADMRWMKKLVSEGMVDSGAVHIFAHNKLVVIVPAENQAGVNQLQDLARPGLRLIMADKSVPAGRYALEFLQKCGRTGVYDTSFQADVLRNVISYEENVRSVVTKVELGECDAGIVYHSDLFADKSFAVKPIKIPDELNVTASYPIAVLKESRNAVPVNDFVVFVLSPEGQNILKKYGLIPGAADSMTPR